jgi:hypothetical protein
MQKKKSYMLKQEGKKYKKRNRKKFLKNCFKRGKNET